MRQAKRVGDARSRVPARSADPQPWRWFASVALLVATSPACALRYTYRVPAAQLTNFDVASGPVTLRNDAGGTVTTSVDRVAFSDARTVDLEHPSAPGGSFGSSDPTAQRRLYDRRASLARIRLEALDHPRGEALLTAADGRNYAPTVGLVTGLLGGGAAGVAACAAGGGDSAGVCMAILGPLGVLAGSLAGWGLGALVGAVMTRSPIAATLVDPTPVLPGRPHAITPPVPERRPQRAGVFRPRARLAVGGLLSVVRAPLSGGIAGDGVGIYLRGGAQIREGFGVEVEGSFATFVSTSSLRGALMLVWTWDDLFSFGTGLGGTQVTSGGFLGAASTRSTVMLAVPLRAAFFLGGRAPGGARRGFEITTQIDLGGVIDGHFGASASASLGLGYTMF